MKRLLGVFITLLIIMLPASVAHAGQYDGRDRDGGYSYRHHRGSDDGYRSYRDDGGYYRHSHDDGYNDGDEGDGNGYSGDQSDRCRSGGCNNRSRRCDRSSGDCRSSFSPGPFDHSPVYICSPYSCNSGGEQSGNNGDGDGGKPPPKQPTPKDGEESIAKNHS